MSFESTRPKHTKFDVRAKAINKDTFLEFDVTLLSSFPQSVPGKISHLFSHNDITHNGSIFFPAFKKAEEAVKHYEAKWKFPYNIVEDARSMAGELTYILQSDNNPRIVRKQERGRFDCGSSARVLRDIHLGKFSIQNTRPFKRRLKGQVSRPSIAIAIQGNFGFMWANEENIPNAARAGLALAWAAQALDCEVNVFVCLTHPEHKGQNIHSIMKIVASDDSIPLHNLGSLFHRDLYRHGWSALFCHHEKMFEYHRYNSDGAVCGVEPHKAISYLKSQYKPDITVAIGAGILDAKEADVFLPSDTLSPNEIISNVAKILDGKLKVAA